MYLCRVSEVNILVITLDRLAITLLVLLGLILNASPGESQLTS